MRYRGVSGRTRRLANTVNCNELIFTQKYSPANKDDRPSELHSNRNAVGSGVLAVLGGVVHDGSQEQTDCNSQLVSSNNCATDPFWRSFTLVHRNCKRISHDLKTGEIMQDILKAEIRPTPYPAKKRPAMKSSCVVEAVWRMTPRLKTTPAEAIKPQRLPSKSPKGAAVRAPKKVPAERMETINES